MLRKIDQNLWVKEQPLKYWGLEVGTRMTLIRLLNGNLVVISPIKVDRATVAQINSLGNVAFIVAPNLYHYLFIADFKIFYPKAKLYSIPGLESKLKNLPIDRVLAENELIWREIDYLYFKGFKVFDLSRTSLLNEVVFFHRESQTLILTDTAFYFDQSFSLTTQFVFQLLGGYQKLRPSLLEKLATQEKEKVKQSVQKILTWDFKRVIMAHGSIVEQEAKKKLKEGYEWFLEASL